METTFKTRTKNDLEAIICIRYNQYNSKLSKNEEIQFSTPYTIQKKDWIKGFPKGGNSTKQLRENLTTIKLKMDGYINDVIADENRLPTHSELTHQVNLLFGKVKKEDFKSLYVDYLATRENKITKATKEQTRIAFEALFEKYPNVQLQDIDKTFTDKLTLHFETKTKINKEGEKYKAYSNVTINKFFKNYITFLNWCYERDKTSTNLTKYFTKLKTTDKEIIALEEDEVSTLELAELDSCMDKIRNLFLFSCYTGLRFSDMQLVKADMIDKGILTINQVKTGSTVRIPLLPKAVDILEKYDYQLPTISNQKANDYLKVLFTKLKLKRKVLATRFNKMIPLDKMVSFHVSRKTYITLALTAGIPAAIVKQVSGHSSDKIFNKYINFSTETLIKEMAKMAR